MKPIRTFARTSLTSVYPLSAISVAAAIAVAACGGGGGGAASGGGGGGAASGTSTPLSSGIMQVRAVDGPALDYTNVWVTIKQIWVHQLDTADSTTAGWQKLTLATPVTLDLNQLANGAMSSVLGSLSLPVGTYRQIRLVLAASDDALTTSAQSQTPPLQFNDQVNYVDINGVARVAPLEIAQATQGIQLIGTFNITAGGTLDLAVEFDVGHDVAKFKHGGLDAFTMTPLLHYYDLSQSGAINGQIDPSGCKSLAANPCNDFVIKAEQLSADGTYHSVTRWTAARADGTFTLFPLPAGAGQTYDLMLRGRNTQTMIVRTVPVTVGTSPTQGATVLSAAPLTAHSASEFNVNWASPADPTGVYGRFYQTVGASGSVPYEIRTHVLNPFTGEFTDDFPLVEGSVLLGDYFAGGTPSLVATVPTQGAGAYLPALAGWGLARALAPVVTATTPGVTTQIATPAMQQGVNVAGLGTITGTLSQTTPGRFDSGYLVVVRGGEIVNTVNVGSVLAAAGAGAGFSIGNLPAGSASNSLGKNGNGAGIYYAYLRVWNSAQPLTTIKLVPIPGFADLDSSNTATLNATLP